MNVNTSEGTRRFRRYYSLSNLTRFYWAPGNYYYHRRRRRRRHRFSPSCYRCTVLSWGLTPSLLVLLFAYSFFFYKKLLVSLHFSPFLPPRTVYNG